MSLQSFGLLANFTDFRFSMFTKMLISPLSSLQPESLQLQEYMLPQATV
jgi:hypothetical protein